VNEVTIEGTREDRNMFTDMLDGLDERLHKIETQTWSAFAIGDQTALYAALADAQGEFPPIPKDRTVKVQTKTGGSYTFSYAPLDTILEKVRPALAKHGLSLIQTFDGNTMTTTLAHSAGGTVQSRFEVRQGTHSWQEFGSAITYARRYAITALLCVASEEDDDGNAASGNTAKQVGKDAPEPSSRRAGPSEKQIGLIKGLIRETAETTGTEEDALERYALDSYNITALEELSAGRGGTASQLISRLHLRLCQHWLGTMDADRAAAVLYEFGADSLDSVDSAKVGDLLKRLKEEAAA
jgi:hypothetical protein